MSGDRETKCWGTVWHLFSNTQVAISHLEVTAGWRCSRHTHQQRDNLFCVVSGSIAVDVWGRGRSYTTTYLCAGDTYTVPAGTLHRFRVLVSGEVVEVYTPARPGCAVRLDDIQRIDEGGRDE